MITVWTLPSPAIPAAVPVYYQHGVSTKTEGGCLAIFDAENRQLTEWGVGAWQRADFS